MKTNAAALASLVLALSWAEAAPAQTMMTTAVQQPSAFGQEPVIRITATFRSATAAAEGQPIPDSQAQETARRAIYAMALKECAVLSETFKAECRLGSVMIYTPSGPPSAPSPNVLTGNASYELRVTGRASGQ